MATSISGRRPCAWFTEPCHGQVVGGFVLAHGSTMLRLWQERHTDIPNGLWLLRVYLAHLEMIARRGSRGGRFGPAEVCTLMGVQLSPANLGRAARNLDRLAQLGAIIQTQNQRRSADVGMSMLALKVHRCRRRVPIPRGLVRRMAATSTVAQLGLLLAVVLRCLHNHVAAGESHIRPAGRLQVAWVARVFGLDRSAVIRAKKRLITEGVIQTHATPQFELNRWGERTVVKLQWKVPESAPSAVPNPRPCLNQHPLRSAPRLEHQHPAQSGPAGVLRSITWKNVQREDLADFTRLSILFMQRQQGPSRADNPAFVDFVAMAERAREESRHPERLFVWLVKNDKRGFITESQEQRAYALAKRGTFGESPKRVREPASPRYRIGDRERMLRK